MTSNGHPLLAVEDVHKAFAVRRPLLDRLMLRSAARAIAVDSVSLEVRRRETLGLVGECGSGKTTLARCILRLIEADQGSIRFDGRELCASRSELQEVRRRMQIVFQDPYSSLNPRLRVGSAIAEPALVHGTVMRERAREHVERMLGLVGLPATAADRYPRQLSGGQRQRVAIARALSLEPEILVADEPVSALADRHRKPAARGDVPSPLRIPSGCRFRTRCAFSEERCAVDDPPLLAVGHRQEAACHVLPFRAAR